MFTCIFRCFSLRSFPRKSKKTRVSRGNGVFFADIEIDFRVARSRTSHASPADSCVRQPSKCPNSPMRASGPACRMPKCGIFPIYICPENDVLLHLQESIGSGTACVQRWCEFTKALVSRHRNASCLDNASGALQRLFPLRLPSSTDCDPFCLGISMQDLERAGCDFDEIRRAHAQVQAHTYSNK